MWQALLVVASLVYAAPSDPACSDPESLILDMLQTEPRTTAILEGQKITSFFAKMADHGWGVKVHKIDKIYLIDAKMKPEADGQDVWAFFLFAGCIMDREVMDKSIVEALL